VQEVGDPVLHRRLPIPTTFYENGWSVKTESSQKFLIVRSDSFFY